MGYGLMPAYWVENFQPAGRMVLCSNSAQKADVVAVASGE